MVGWNDELVIRPDTPLTPAQKKQLAKAIKRAKRDGKIAASAQQTIPYEEMYQNGVCSLGNRLYSIAGWSTTSARLWPLNCP